MNWALILIYNFLFLFNLKKGIEVKMDFEQLQRIDLLSRQLKENGLASSFEEATQKASAIINKTENSGQTNDEKLEILQQRFQFKLNSLEQKYGGNIQELKKTVTSLSAELIDIKRKVMQLQQIPKQEVQSTLIGQQTVNKEEAREKKDFDKISPDTKRTELDPEDFSVEKYFYCGVK